MCAPSRRRPSAAAAPMPCSASNTSRCWRARSLRPQLYSMPRTIPQLREDSRRIFMAGVAAVDPVAAVQRAVVRRGETLDGGGGSSLLPGPSPGITLEEKQRVTGLFLECGASIDELNAMRKHISRLKGGQLARLVAPATLITLVLSDVVGDRLDVIASGPTVPDPTTYQDCLAIVQRYNLLARLPTSVHSHLQRGQAGELSETPKATDAAFAGCQTVIIGRHRLA